MACALAASLLAACGDDDGDGGASRDGDKPPEITAVIDCAKKDLKVVIDKVTHSRPTGRSQVTVTFTVTCAGAPVKTKHGARTKITRFLEQKLHDAAPDAKGQATVKRAEKTDPGEEKITVTVKGADGEVTSEPKEIPAG